MRPLMLILALTTLYFAHQQQPSDMAFATYFGKAIPAKAESAPRAEGFHRGFTDKQGQPCADDRGGHYQSEIISKAEHLAITRSLGISDDHGNILAAIARAESGNQLNCFGDDYKPYIGQRTAQGTTWGPSYGTFQIRTIDQHKGKGDCRDIKRLRNNLEEQTKCAWEISQHGKNYRPWSVYLNGKYRQYLGQEW